MYWRRLLLIVFCVGFPQTQSLADEIVDARHFESLAATLEKIVPQGWSLERDSTGRKNRRAPRPTIRIVSNEPLQFELPVAPNPPAEALKQTADDRLRVEPIAISISAAAFVSPKQHEETRTRIAGLLKQRIDFESRRLRGVAYGFMGPQPIPPDAYRASNPEEERALREYAFLWLQTEATRLPSHHYETLSFDLIAPLDVKIQDEGKQREFDQIVERLESIVHPYVAREAVRAD